MRLSLTTLTFAFCALALGWSCDGGSGIGKSHALFSDEEWDIVRSLAFWADPPADPTNAVADDAAAAMLGQKFFFDSRFSGPLVHPDNENAAEGGNGSVGTVGAISCARCHDPDAGFSDRTSVPATSSLAAGRTQRHTQSVLNAAYQDWFFWDGRADSLWSQALGPIESPDEHNFNRVGVVQLIFSKYRGEYEAIFGAMPSFDDDTRFPQVPNPPAFEGQGRPGDGPGGAGLDSFDEISESDQALVNEAFANFGKSIAAYERQLVSRNSAFDRFVDGEENAIGAAAKRGLKLFIGDAFCVSCHNGSNFSDGEFNNTGLAQSGAFIPLSDSGRFGGVPLVLTDPFNGEGGFSDSTSTGSAKLSGLVQEESQRGRFKTPSLRSISDTGPYFHTGSLRSLREVVEFYNRGGDGNGFDGVADPLMVPLGLNDEQLSDLVEFLETLSGEELPIGLRVTPTLPP
ncbi:MAG: cytochrome c peroxidase [Planctomycetota bacterium]